MQEVIDELLKAEADAQKLIAQAQEEVRKTKARADGEFSLKINQAREEARRLILAEVEKTRTAVKQANDAALKEAQARADGLWEDNRGVIGELTDEVIDLILTPEYEKE